jgi:hypothetical protein
MQRLHLMQKLHPKPSNCYFTLGIDIIQTKQNIQNITYQNNETLQVN